MFNFKHKNLFLGFLLVVAGVIGGQSALLNSGVSMVVGEFAERSANVDGAQ